MSVALAHRLRNWLAILLIIGGFNILFRTGTTSASTFPVQSASSPEAGAEISILHNTAVPSIAPVSSDADFVRPLSSSGCTGVIPGLNGEFGVCISVNGSGTYISTISTSGYALHDGCSSALLLRNGSVIKQAPTVCYGNTTTIC